jgi:hypothetical protein
LRHRFEQAGHKVIVAIDRSGQYDRARLTVEGIAVR